MSKSITIVKKSQGLFSTLRQVRESNQGIVVYHFEESVSYNDYKSDPSNKPITTEEVRRKWTIQQPINAGIFTNNKGKNNSLEDVAEIFKTTAHDLGAKYFTI